jgi:uncharacterized protein (DUF58 family)
LEYAQQLSAALSHLILTQGDSVGLTIFDSEIQTYIPPRNRKDQWGNILETLVEFTSSNRESSIAHTLTEMTEWLKKRGMVIIISDMIEDPDTLLHNLAILSSSHQEVIIFHVLTPEEIELPFSGTVEFKPLEGDDDPMLTTPKRLRARYQEKVHSFLEKYKNGCAKLKIDYNLVKTDQPLEQVLREYLQHRFKVAIRS